MLRLIGVVTLSGDFTDELLHLRTTTFAAASLLPRRPYSLHALCPGPQGAVWRWLLAADIALVCALFLIRSLRLFLRKKFRFCIGFCTFCAVELFPLSLVWLSIARQ